MSETMPQKPYVYQPPHNDGVSIIYQDEAIVVVSKPAGLLSVPGRNPTPENQLGDCMIARVQEIIPDALIVHRLDGVTSGLMVMARTKEVHADLGLQFEKRKVGKVYIAKIWGKPRSKGGTIDLPLICDWPNRPRQIVDYKDGKSAQTRWEATEHGDNWTRVTLRPTTGRTHQLRVHMQAMGHPILGDDLYAHKEAFEAADRLYLHAQDLAFTHPTDGRALTFCDPCPF